MKALLPLLIIPVIAFGSFSDGQRNYSKKAYLDSINYELNTVYKESSAYFTTHGTPAAAGTYGSTTHLGTSKNTPNGSAIFTFSSNIDSLSDQSIALTPSSKDGTISFAASTTFTTLDGPDDTHEGLIFEKKVTPAFRSSPTLANSAFGGGTSISQAAFNDSITNDTSSGTALGRLQTNAAIAFEKEKDSKGNSFSSAAGNAAAPAKH